MTLNRGQKIGLLIAVLLALIGIAWAFDLMTESGFWRTAMRILFEIVGHLR